METWKPVKDYEELYEVSSLGRVRAIKTNKLLKKFITNKYYSCGLSRKGHTKHLKVHRMVASSFIPNGNNYPQVNHIDGDKLNNCVNNLEWVTRQQNLEHAWKMGLGPSPRAVIQYKSGIEIGRFKSPGEAEKVVGGCGRNIKKVCDGINKKCSGYEWKYAN